MLGAGLQSAVEKLAAGAEEKASAMGITILDQGRFAFLEFEDPDTASDGPAVSGIHVLQILPTSLACQATYFPVLNPSLQVKPSLECALRNTCARSMFIWSSVVSLGLIGNPQL